MNGNSLCALHLAAGRREACPGPDCAFWEAGGAVVEPACGFERVRLELEGRPAVARWLLGIRETVENARSPADLAAAWSALGAFLPPGLHE
jgi:hypothetical protein